MKDIRVGDVVLWDGDYWLVSTILKGDKYALFIAGFELEERSGEEIEKVFREVKPCVLLERPGWKHYKT